MMRKYSEIVFWMVVCGSCFAGPIRSGYQFYEPQISHYPIYQGIEDGQHYAYNHCASVEWFDGKFWTVWNGNMLSSEEGVPGQKALLSTSTDFVNWSDPVNFSESADDSENPMFADPPNIGWQPNLLNFNDQELWCLWMRAPGDLRYHGTFFSTIGPGNDAKWVHRKLARLGSLKGDNPTGWVGQNPTLLQSGRVVVPMIWAGGEELPQPDWRIKKPKWVGVLYTDDAGESWHASNVVSLPYNVAAAWEASVHEQIDGQLRMYLRNIELSWPPAPTKRLLTATGTGSQKGQALKFAPDSQNSYIETAHDRQQVIRLPGDRWAMFRHDIYSPQTFYQGRQNGALFFSRTGRNDFVASVAFKPTDFDPVWGFCSYPQGIYHDGKIYVVYTAGNPFPAYQPRSIEGAIIDPAPDPDAHYIWPRDKDYLVMQSGGERANTDYVYTRPYLQSVDQRSAIVFQDRGTAGVEIDDLDFEKGQALRVSLDIKVESISAAENTILFSFGDRIPIRLGIHTEDLGYLSVQARDGWQRVRPMIVDDWFSLVVYFGREAFTVQVNDGPVTAFLNPVLNPNPRLYLGDGYEVDETLSNVSGRFYIDKTSFSTQVIEPTSLTVLDAEVHGPIVKDATDHIFRVNNPANDTESELLNILSQAVIYLPFEGTDGGLGSAAWQNKGKVGYGESTSRLGSGTNPTVTAGGLKGQAYDGSMLTPMSGTNGTYMYGAFDGSTPMEEALKDIWSFTVSGWIKVDASSDYAQGRILASNPFEINYIMDTGGGINARLATRVDNSSVFHNSSHDATKYASKDAWRFVAVTYDGAKSDNQLTYYHGTASDAVSKDISVTADYGKLETYGSGGNLWLGNTRNFESGDRPFVGYMDEWRVWVGKDAARSAALDAAKLEWVRQFDLSEETYHGPEGTSEIPSFSGVEVFEEQRKELYFDDFVDFSGGEAFSVVFDVKVTETQFYGNTVICSFGSERSPIRLVIPGDRPGRLYTYGADGWLDAGAFELAQWNRVRLVVGRNSFTVQVNDGDKVAFTNPLLRPGTQFYFGDGWDVDYIPTNTDAVFEIDYDSVAAQIVSPDLLETVSSAQVGAIVKDATSTIFLINNSGTEVDLKLGESEIPKSPYLGIGGYPYHIGRHIVSEAAIYFPFEGADEGLTGESWKNRGSQAYNESPVIVGTDSGVHTPTVTPDGVKGQAYDSSMMREHRNQNAYRWGFANREVTPIEEQLGDIMSFTITMWIKTDQWGNQSRLLVTPQFNLSYRGNWGDSYLECKVGDNNFVNSSNVFSSVDHWRFLAVVYDGTRQSDNLSFYFADKNTPVQHDKTVSIQGGVLPLDNMFGAPLYLGNHNIVADRPFVGYIDEVRIWTDKQGDGAALTNAEIEAVRLWDTEGCSVILDGDINLDCLVNYKDMAMLAEQWLSSGPELVADLTQGGVVDWSDFMTLVDQWLQSSAVEEQ